MLKNTDTRLDPLSASIDPPEPLAPTPGLSWFYALWATLAILSSAIGHSSISSNAALFLLGGICSTSFFFVIAGRGEHADESFGRLLAGYQTALAIAWTSAYLYFSQGASDLVLGMYVTILMYAVFHLSPRLVALLGGAALGSYLLILAIKTAALPALVAPLADGLRFVVLAAIVGWIIVYARKLRDLRLELQYRNEELQSVVDRVTKMAEEDHLTKSFNRRHIMEVIARERSRADRSGGIFSILLFDLDHFKAVNDQYGHVVGDQILSDFAARVKTELRGMDSVNTTEHRRSFGRYGGEEFLAVLPGTDAEGAERCAERIRHAISQHAFRDQYNITVSAGVAEYQLGETVPQLLTRADEALYQAKRSGRNRVCSSPPEQRRDTGTVPNLRILK